MRTMTLRRLLFGAALCLSLSHPHPAMAVPITMDFSGAFGGAGLATGSFSYETDEAPIAMNVRGLTGNAVYALTGWDFTIVGAATILPSTEFSSALAGNTAEFCLGGCVFASPAATNLILRNGDNLLMQLTFNLVDPTPLSSPPSSVTEWGSLREGVYRVPCPICVPVTIFTSGTLTPGQNAASVPEPSTAMLLALSVIGLLGWEYRRRTVRR